MHQSLRFLGRLAVVQVARARQKLIALRQNPPSLRDTPFMSNVIGGTFCSLRGGRIVPKLQSLFPTLWSNGHAN
jgi:hypothetical protein